MAQANAHFISLVNGLISGQCTGGLVVIRPRRSGPQQCAWDWGKLGFAPAPSRGVVLFIPGFMEGRDSPGVGAPRDVLAF